jgi:hypothetical protein
VKKNDLIRAIRDAAAAQMVGVVGPTGSGRGNHETYEVGGQKVPIPRHKEINEYTALRIMKDLEGTLGKDWWQ